MFCDGRIYGLTYFYVVAQTQSFYPNNIFLMHKVLEGQTQTDEIPVHQQYPACPNKVEQLLCLQWQQGLPSM